MHKKHSKPIINRVQNSTFWALISRPWAYFDLIKLDIPDSSGVSPSGSSSSRSPSLPSMENPPRGSLVVKPTRGEIRARVELLAKKKRSVKRRA